MPELKVPADSLSHTALHTAWVRRFVTLAAGIDGRTTRLPCPPGTRWPELDLPGMTEFEIAAITCRCTSRRSRATRGRPR
ncbi:class I SAM-dependent methyltransferase [Lentzea sp. CA-135723]|uniref:class I SAM-dependent methyltransferase n=1 Tax=Lentzea sp. CA-135723 TaxID=3239950 RepID=UPI003D8A1B87